MTDAARHIGHVASDIGGGHEQKIVPVGVRLGDSQHHQGIVNALKT
jgi:hypothetical protein